MTIDTLPIRLKSGVKRTISAWTAFLFGVHCISLSSSGLIPFSWVASVWPGASIVGVLTVAVSLCFIHALAYSIIGACVPFEGADYYFSSRTLTPKIGFVASWTLVLFSGIVAGGLAAWVPTSALPSLLRPMSIILNDPRYADLSDIVSSPFGSFVVGLAIIAISAVASLRVNAALNTMLTFGFFLGVASWAVILWSLASADHSQFERAWNHFMASSSTFGAYDKRIELARAAGMITSNSTWKMTLAGSIMGFWIFYGYYIPSFFAEEVKSPRKSIVAASISSLIFTFLIFLAAAVLLERLVPLEWISAEGYISNNADLVKAATKGVNVTAMPWITFYAAILKPYPVLIFFVAFSWVFTLVNLVQTYLFYTSRIIFSWGLDGVLPSWVLGSVGNESFNRVIGITSMLAVLGLIDAAYGGPLGTQLKFAFFAVVTGLVPISALVLLPWLRPRMFQNVPERARKRLFGIPVSSYIGGITLSYLIWMVVASFIFPAVGLDNPTATLTILLFMVSLGFLFYTGMKWYRRRVDSIDIEDTYRYDQIDTSASEDEFV